MSCEELWGGVPVPPEEPPHPVATRTRASTIISSIGVSLPRTLARRPANPTQQNTLSTIPPIGDGLSCKGGVFRATKLGATVTVRVTDEGLEPFSVTLAGLNTPVTPVGNEGQLKVTVSVSPPIGVAVTVNCAEWPGKTVALVGVAARLYRGEPLALFTF